MAGPRSKEMAGQRFGRLIAISKHSVDAGGNASWLCKCDCGKETVAKRKHLRAGTTTSCGCLALERYVERTLLPVAEAGANAIYNRYKQNAKKRGLAFELTRAEVAELISLPCRYCGAPPAQRWPTPSLMKRSRIQASRGIFWFNGIDRRDSNVGYQIGNVVPCCEDCNFAKNSMPEERFLAWVARLARHLCP